GFGASTSVTVNIDKTLPVVTITSPAAGTPFLPGSITVTGNVTESLSGLASVTCQGTAAQLSGSSFSCSVPIVVGTNTITVLAKDRADNTGTATLSLQGVVPTITLVNPNTGPQGKQNLSVNLTGQYTHFSQGTTTASFGAGITVASLVVSSPTSVTAVLNID